jgi:hypothetical protein
MTCGGETTREDEIIYGEVTGGYIDKAVKDLWKLFGGEDNPEEHQVRTILEYLVYKSILEVENNGPW